jgi:hypothetical protein
VIRRAVCGIVTLFAFVISGAASAQPADRPGEDAGLLAGDRLQL